MTPPFYFVRVDSSCHFTFSFSHLFVFNATLVVFSQTHLALAGFLASPNLCHPSMFVQCLCLQLLILNHVALIAFSRIFFLALSCCCSIFNLLILLSFVCSSLTPNCIPRCAWKALCGLKDSTIEFSILNSSYPENLWRTFLHFCSHFFSSFGFVLFFCFCSIGSYVHFTPIRALWCCHRLCHFSSYSIIIFSIDYIKGEHVKWTQVIW